MFLPEKLGRQNHAFLILAGLSSAALSGGVCWYLISSYGHYRGLYGLAVSTILASAAFLAFYVYPQLLSARTTVWMLGRAALRWTRVALVAMVLFFFFLYEEIRPATLRVIVLQWMIVTLPLQLLLLMLLRRVALVVNNAPQSRRKAIFVGLGPEAIKLSERLQRSPVLGIEAIGYYADRRASATGEARTGLRYLGTYSEAPQTIGDHGADIVFVTMMESQAHAGIRALTEHLYDSTGSIYFLPEPEVSEDFSVHSTEIAGVPLLALHETTVLGAARIMKRAIDITLALIVLLVVWPVLVLVAIAVKLDSPGPVIFRQQRYGEHGKPFLVYKFRSMRMEPEGEAVLRQVSRDDDRVTRVGRFLRRWSLDELPQLFNVLNGTMSLVGPRPHAASHNEFYRRQIRGYMLRHTVKPGITGWAQVNGLRGETETLDKMQRRVLYDRYYITNWSVWLDLKILFRTLMMVVGDKNAY